MCDPGKEHYLNDTWMIYFHDPYNSDWNLSSYKRLTSAISTVEDYSQHWFCLKKNVEKGMFFLMREHVFPSWDSPENINGGTLNIKVLKESLADFFQELTFNLLGETLLGEKFRNKIYLINGISTSPKKHFCIVKIWISNNDLSDKKYFDISHMYHGDIIYKSNRENITNENTRIMRSSTK